MQIDQENLACHSYDGYRNNEISRYLFSIDHKNICKIK